MERVAEAYASVEDDHWWFAGRRAIVRAALGRLLPSGSSLLDVGCGTGGLTAALAQRYRVEGVDPSPAAAAQARARGLLVHLLELGEELPRGFDAVGAFDVLEHVRDDLGLARRLTAATRRGGLVVVTVPAFPMLWGPMDETAGHVRRYRLAQLAAVMEAAGLRRVHATYFNTLLFPAYAAARLAGLPRKGRELAPPGPLVNRVLRRVLELEAPLASRLRMPVGGSILYLGRKR